MPFMLWMIGSTISVAWSMSFSSAAGSVLSKVAMRANTISPLSVSRDRSAVGREIRKPACPVLPVGTRGEIASCTGIDWRNEMRKWTIVAALVLGVALIAQASAVGSSGGETVLKFNTRVGGDGPFRGATHEIRGVPGAGAPWRVDSVDGKLKSGGRLTIDVEGLVLVSTGLNPSASFHAIVSCLTNDATTVSTVDLLTDAFSATNTGDAEIDADVALPSPCVAPIVLVTNAAGTSWFAGAGP